jgi:protein TonB
MVGKDGGIRELKLIRGSLLLGRSAFQAVKQWRYKPYLVNGEAVEMQTFITVNFVHSTHAALAQK